MSDMQKPKKQWPNKVNCRGRTTKNNGQKNNYMIEQKKIYVQRPKKLIAKMQRPKEFANKNKKLFNGQN